MALNKIQVITSSWKTRDLLGKIIYIWRVPLLLLILIYQKTISPDHGLMKGFFPHGYCRFHPTCSDYGFAAAEKYGIFKGVVLMIWRIIRCNPWNEGGEDQLK